MSNNYAGIFCSISSDKKLKNPLTSSLIGHGHFVLSYFVAVGTNHALNSILKLNLKNCEKTFKAIENNWI